MEETVTSSDHDGGSDNNILPPFGCSLTTDATHRHIRPINDTCGTVKQTPLNNEADTAKPLYLPLSVMQSIGDTWTRARTRMRAQQNLSSDPTWDGELCSTFFSFLVCLAHHKHDPTWKFDLLRIIVI